MLVMEAAYFGTVGLVQLSGTARARLLAGQQALLAVWADAMHKVRYGVRVPSAACGWFAASS